MIRNIIVTAELDSTTARDNHVQAIRDHINNNSYDLTDYNIVERQNPDDKPSFRGVIKFNYTSDNQTFWDWLKGYIQNNSSDFNYCEMTNHDCMHMASNQYTHGVGITIQGIQSDTMDVDTHKTNINDWIQNNITSVTDKALSTGDLPDQKTVGINIKLDNSEEKTLLKNFLMNYFDNHKNAMENPRLIDHENADKNYPCRIGDRWSL